MEVRSLRKNRYPIPDDLSRIWNYHLTTHNQYRAMRVHLNHISAFDQLSTNSDWDSDVPGPINTHLSQQKRVSKNEMLKLMQQNHRQKK